MVTKRHSLLIGVSVTIRPHHSSQPTKIYVCGKSIKIFRFKIVVNHLMFETYVSILLTLSKLLENILKRQIQSLCHKRRFINLYCYLYIGIWQGSVVDPLLFSIFIYLCIVSSFFLIDIIIFMLKMSKIIILFIQPFQLVLKQKLWSMMIWKP